MKQQATGHVYTTSRLLFAGEVGVTRILVAIDPTTRGTITRSGTTGRSPEPAATVQARLWSIIVKLEAYSTALAAGYI